MSNRRFDHDLARKLHGEGKSIRQLAVLFNVGPTAVWKALHPEHRPERVVGDAQCDDCPNPMNSSSRRSGSLRCRSCAAKHRHKMAGTAVPLPKGTLRA